MRKILLFTVVVFLGCIATNAQVKLGLGIGYALPSGDISDFADSGFSMHLELGYGIKENIDVSLLYQGSFLSGKNAPIGNIENVFLGSYMINGRYYFKESGLRPYGSLGVGMTVIGALELDGTGTDLQVAESTSNFSFRPAIGFKYGILNVNAAYLSAGKIGNSSVSDFSLNVGMLFTFGGN